MESYNNSYTTTNSASSSSSYSADQFSSEIYQHGHQEEKRWKQQPPQAHRSSLHSVRKSVITKKPISPMPAPNPPKVYKVDPVDFRDVVQRLTGGAPPEFLPTTRLQEVAPPPLTISPQEDKPRNKRLTESNFEAISPHGFSLSPSSLEWCSSILLTPRTL
ncbi:hypothetical protein ABFX02_08G058700 [Erythranthe guttata]